MTTKRQVALVTGFAASLIFIGVLRYSGFNENPLTPLSGYATVLYVATTVIAAVLLVRSGMQLNRLGFGFRLSIRHVILALAAVAMLQLIAAVVDPVLESLFGAGRDLNRFAGVQGSASQLALTLAFSWTFAAFGEELAFRIVLLRGLWSILGGTRTAGIIALVLQAIVFGLVHIYQGPSGVVGTTISGLVFGVVTVAARGAIWPAALAHGINNTIGLVLIFQGAAS